MNKPHNLYNTLKELPLAAGKTGYFYSLPQLAKAGFSQITRLPVSLQIILESVLRHYDGNKITEEHIKQIANWQPNAKDRKEVPFTIARIILQDYTGVPLLADLAAMRDAVSKLGHDPNMIEPQVPVSLIVDHSVQTYYTKRQDALKLNMQIEYERNSERYQFIKWGSKAFNKLKIIPPGNGIIHQINLEYLAKGVLCKNNIYFPDSVVGTDSHTTMINGIGVVGWGVGGIEAETGILGQPIHLLLPDVVGVHLQGSLREGVTATDLVLTLTSLLRKAKVVGKIIEYFGEGAAALSVPDRATIANMAPDYGATMGFFPIDENTLTYYATTGRTMDEVDTIRRYFKAQNLFGIKKPGECEYSQIIELDLSTVVPSVAGPKRPQDHINLSDIKSQFETLLNMPVKQNGYDIAGNLINKTYRTDNIQIKHGDVLIAAITSCTNTSNPSVLLAAGILAKKAVAKGLQVKSHIKTSLTPGSLVVTEYLKQAQLLAPLEQLGFNVAGYGCATCNGNVGGLMPAIEQILTEQNIIAASVLSGNRNFEARIHPNIRANFLMSPPLVIAFAIAGTVRIDFANEPLGYDQNQQAVYLKDIWPTTQEIQAVLSYATQPAVYRHFYDHSTQNNSEWQQLPEHNAFTYQWDAASTYITKPPFLNNFALEKKSITNIYNARALAVLGDSITTDHISPVGNISVDSPAGHYLQQQGVKPMEFNSYGARRGHHEIMVRGTFANSQLKNYLVPDLIGGFTMHPAEKMPTSIFAAAMRYKQEQVPVVIFAGEEYGTGSSRDWAAKGTYLLGVRAVIARSFERIHRSNLIGMGVLPCQFKNSDSVAALQLTGNEVFDLTGLDQPLKINQEIPLIIKYADGSTKTINLILQLKTQIEIDYFTHGGILPYMLRQLLVADYKVNLFN